MAWIRTVEPEDATGDLARLYDEAVSRAGKVFHVVRLSSVNPELDRAFLQVYLVLMHGPSPLSRREREMLATAVSRANQCHY